MTKTAQIDITGLTSDTLTAAVTAFLTFEEMLEKCRAGYVPTLHARGRAGHLAEELARRVEAAGHRVFRGLL